MFFINFFRLCVYSSQFFLAPCSRTSFLTLWFPLLYFITTKNFKNNQTKKCTRILKYWSKYHSGSHLPKTKSVFFLRIIQGIRYNVKFGGFDLAWQILEAGNVRNPSLKIFSHCDEDYFSNISRAEINMFSQYFKRKWTQDGYKNTHKHFHDNCLIFIHLVKYLLISKMFFNVWSISSEKPLYRCVGMLELCLEVISALEYSRNQSDRCGNKKKLFRRNISYISNNSNFMSKRRSFVSKRRRTENACWGIFFNTHPLRQKKRFFLVSCTLANLHVIFSIKRR